MKIILSILILVWFSVILFAGEPIKIVTTLPEFKNFAEIIGGDLVQVTSLSNGKSDSHHLEIKPSDIIKVKKADLLIINGLELDNWIYPLIENSRNGKIQKGTPGFLDASGAISVLEIPVKVDRGMGDVHPAGNPHYILSPYAMRKVFQSVLAFMSQNDPEHKAVFQKNAEAYLKQFDLKLAAWQKKLKPLAGTRVVSFHSSWIYFFNDFGLESGGYMEPVPGIAPSPAHTLELIEKMKKENTKIIFKETFYADDTPALIAEKTGAKVVVLPVSIGGSAEAQDYFSLIDTLVNGVQP